MKLERAKQKFWFGNFQEFCFGLDIFRVFVEVWPFSGLLFRFSHFQECCFGLAIFRSFVFVWPFLGILF